MRRTPISEMTVDEVIAYLPHASEAEMPVLRAQVKYLHDELPFLKRKVFREQLVNELRRYGPLLREINRWFGTGD